MRQSKLLRIELLFIGLAEIAGGLVKVVLGVPLRWDAPDLSYRIGFWAWKRYNKRLPDDAGVYCKH